MKITNIKTIYSCIDEYGKEREITAEFSDNGWEQYGGMSHQLGDTLPLTEAINEAIQQVRFEMPVLFDELLEVN